MPASLTYPGVYIEEVPSAVRTIVGVPTAIAAFVGSAARGPTDAPAHLTSWADFQRSFGGLTADGALGYAVFQYFQNGGGEAEVVRLTGAGAEASTLDLGGGSELTASSAGTWGDGLRARVDYGPVDDGETYNLTVRDTATGATERFTGITTSAGSARPVDKVLRSSALVSSTGDNTVRPAASADPAPGKDPFADPVGGAPATYVQASGGAAGADLTAGDYTGSEADKTGLYQLLKTDIFNMLVLAPQTVGGAVPDGVAATALELCVDRRAILLVDPPAAWDSVANAATGAPNHPLLGDSARNAAIYFPNVLFADPLDNGVPKAFPPSGALAGVIARTDGQRGVWKAPAGTDASFSGAVGPSLEMNDLENGRLNPIGVNCIRRFPLIGTVSWGARTMRGADSLADQWKYLPVRRTALFIEESLFRGTKWVVFEPNDEPLWASVRLNVGAFMNSLFRQGAFAGSTPRDAYLVQCDKDNNPQAEVDKGVLHILVGFAPLKPAEFVVIEIEQLAGQLQV